MHDTFVDEDGELRADSTCLHGNRAETDPRGHLTSCAMNVGKYKEDRKGFAETGNSKSSTDSV